ncbi:MAG TPA: NAD-dependent epimerase/dehydratase family protein [Pirellulaceae bacterium]|jgi:nucleoside-diphosphate-sugar epimerase
MSTVVVTGGTGFIGSHLVEELVRRGHHVRCIVRPASQVDFLQSLDRVELVKAEFHNGSDLDGLLSGADTVYHAAGLIRAFRSREFYDVNQHGTARIAAACANQSQPPRLIIVSSIAAAGPCPRGQIRLESDPPAPRSHYGRSKLAAEEEAAKFAGKVPTTIVRPGIVFGPRDTGFIQIVRAIRNFRVHLSPGVFPPALSYIHVSDLIELLIIAADRGRTLPPNGGKIEEGRYFAVAPEYPTYSELGYILRKMLGCHFAPVIPVFSPIAYAIGGLSGLISRLKGRAPELNLDKIRDALVTSWACSGEAARRELGFTLPKPLATRLQETIDWCIANGHL